MPSPKPRSTKGHALLVAAAFTANEKSCFAHSTRARRVESVGDYRCVGTIVELLREDSAQVC